LYIKGGIKFFIEADILPFIVCFFAASYILVASIGAYYLNSFLYNVLDSARKHVEKIEESPAENGVGNSGLEMEV
jgi:hypothetical protein